jgi:hypothetical protein
MSRRAQELAEEFERMNAMFAEEIARLAPAQWQAFSPEEGRTVAALTHHVAWAYSFEVDAFRTMAEGRPFAPVPEEALDETNARLGQSVAACDHAETVALLRTNAGAAATWIRSLTDEQLARTGIYIAGEQPETIDALITQVLIGHPGMHLPAIRTAAHGAL